MMRRTVFSLLFSVLLLAGLTLPAAAALDVPDGQYSVEVSLDGDTSGELLPSPIALRTQGDAIILAIVWNDPTCTGLTVDGQTYQPDQTKRDYTLFRFPVSGLDQDLVITAENAEGSLEHTIHFDKDSLTLIGQNRSGKEAVIAAAIVIAGVAIFTISKRVKAKKNG